MKLLLFTLGCVIYFACVVLDIGFTTAYFAKEYPDSASPEGRFDRTLSVAGALFGPISLLVSWELGWMKHGWKWR